MENYKIPLDHLGRPIYDRYGNVNVYNAWPTDEYGRPILTEEQLQRIAARKLSAAEEKARRKATLREGIRRIKNNKHKVIGKEISR
ncbi:MAG: hypothetical protein AAFZ15_32640 [Bacteroidota bacterium]